MMIIANVQGASGVSPRADDMQNAHAKQKIIKLHTIESSSLCTNDGMHLFMKEEEQKKNSWNNLQSVL